jgi:RNA polymerase sigma-70 factor (ECF subfamily)
MLTLVPDVSPALLAGRGWPAFAAGHPADRRLHSLFVTGAELVARFRAGDESAIRDLYRDYGRVVFAIARRALGDRSLAEEAVQQTFLQAWRGAASFDPNRDLAPWIYTIARRVCIDLYRRESRRQAEPLENVAEREPAMISQPGGIEESWQRWQVHTAIDQLPPDERDVVRLQHLQGFTHQEIAQQIGVPLGTVKSRSHRAHRRLAALLGHLEEVPA